MNPEIIQLWEEIEETPDSPAKVGLLEQAIGMADAASDLDTGS